MQENLPLPGGTKLDRRGEEGWAGGRVLRARACRGSLLSSRPERVFTPSELGSPWKAAAP